MIVRADDMTDRYRGGALLHRWSLVAGWPRCILAPLVVAETPAAEVAAAEASNATLRALVAAVEAYEADPEQPVAAEVAALAAQRATEPLGPARVLATAQDGVITALLVTDDPNADGVEVPPAARVGGALPGGTLPPLAVVPADVSFWQFMLAAWQAGFITQAEALDAVRDRAMPATFAAALSALPAEAQAVAAMKFAGITRMVRTDPLFGLLVQAGIATHQQIDAVFAAAAGIR